MPQDPNQLYSVNKTTMWFAIASIVLTISLVLIIGQDYGREWKKWQKKFIELERKQVEAQLKQAQEAVDPKQLETLKLKQKEARERFNQNQESYRRLTADKDA